MTNSRLLANQSRLLARHITSRLDEQAAQDSDENETFIAALFETVLTRRPSTAETTICHDFLQRQETLFGSKSADELAGQTDEKDIPPSAEPAMRARESLVRALLNQNDFVTIR